MNIPFEIFITLFSGSIALALFGFVRDPQVPVMLMVGGLFVLSLAVSTTGIIMGKIPITSVDSGGTTTYSFVDNVFEFTDLHKVLFTLFGSIMMLVSGLMVIKV